MIETATEVGPNLAADICPALTKGEVFAEISAGSGIDHALEQREPIRIPGEAIVRMFAVKLQRRVLRMRAHSFQHVAPDHQEAGAGVADAGEAADGHDAVGIFKLQYIVERGARDIPAVRFNRLPCLVP